VASSNTAWATGFPPPPNFGQASATGGTDGAIGQSGTIDIGQDGSIDIGQMLANGVPPYMFGFDSMAGAGGATAASSSASSSGSTTAVSSSGSLSTTPWLAFGDLQSISSSGSSAASGQQMAFDMNQQLADAIASYSSSGAYGMSQSNLGALALTI
jgi:hypothetical protein